MIAKEWAMKEAADAGSSASSDDGAGKKLSLALVIGLIVCCLGPVIVLSAGVGITSYFLLHESGILTFSGIILILLTIVSVIWTLQNRRSAGRHREINLRVNQQSNGMDWAEETEQRKMGKDRCCEGESKSN
jgi:cell division protein FtsL